MFQRGLCLLILLSFSSFFEPATAQRVEIENEYEADETDFNLVPFDEKGLMIFRETDKDHDWGERVWTFKFYNTDLEEEWSKDISMDKSFEFISSSSAGDKVYYLFNEGGDQTDEVLVMRWNGTSKDAVVMKKELPNKLTQEESRLIFRASEKNAYLLGNSPPGFFRFCGQYFLSCTGISCCFGVTALKSEADFLQFDLEKKRAKKIRLDHEGTTVGRGLQIYEDARTGLILSRIEGTKVHESYYLRHDQKGQSLWSERIKTGDKTYVTNGVSKEIKGEDEVFLVGNYHSLDEQSGWDKFKSSVSRATTGLDLNRKPSGVFFTVIKDKQQRYAKFTSFEDMAEDLDFQLADSEEREKWIEEYLSRMTWVYHEPVKMGNEYVTVAENYKPVYREYRTYNASQGTWETHRVFVGYRLMNAIIMGHNEEGEFQWAGNMMVYTDREEVSWFSSSLFSYYGGTFDQLKRRVNVQYQDNGEVIMSAVRGNKLVSKVFNEGQITRDEKEVSIEPSLDDGELDEANETSVAPWYDDYYISWGYQSLEYDNKDDRELFYISKIKYE